MRAKWYCAGAASACVPLVGWVGVSVRAESSPTLGSELRTSITTQTLKNPSQPLQNPARTPRTLRTSGVLEVLRSWRVWRGGFAEVLGGSEGSGGSGRFWRFWAGGGVSEPRGQRGPGRFWEALAGARFRGVLENRSGVLNGSGTLRNLSEVPRSWGVLRWVMRGYERAITRT